MLRENLSSVVSSIGKNNAAPAVKTQVGRVYGIVTTENTPTEAMFIKAGGFSGIGTIFYLDLTQAQKETGSIDNEFLDKCSRAKPLNPNQCFPLFSELVPIVTLASPLAQITKDSSQKYYGPTINVWNNVQHNSLPANDSASLGLGYFEDPNIRPLLPFIGDTILQGRQGSALRFSTTTKLYNTLNEWSDIGDDKDPITILTNGLNYNPELEFYVEHINEDKSSIYMTSAQKIPLITTKTGVLNNLTNPLNIPDYFQSQIIVNSDRVVLNSKRDEVMIFAKTNIELNTKNVINLNADGRVHLNSNSVFLGPYNANSVPQPVLLGNETINLFIHIQETLTRLAFYLSSAVGVSEGAPVVGLNAAGKELYSDMIKTCDLLSKITSKKVFTS